MCVPKKRSDTPNTASPFFYCTPCGWAATLRASFIISVVRCNERSALKRIVQHRCCHRAMLCCAHRPQTTRRSAWPPSAPRLRPSACGSCSASTPTGTVAVPQYPSVPRYHTVCSVPHLHISYCSLLALQCAFLCFRSFLIQSAANMFPLRVDPAEGTKAQLRLSAECKLDDTNCLWVGKPAHKPHNLHEVARSRRR